MLKRLQPNGCLCKAVNKALRAINSRQSTIC